MSFWETVKSWFRTESESAREWSDEVQTRWSADLDRKEADLRATPAEKMENLQDRISGSTDSFDEIRAKIESSAEAVDLDKPDVDPPDLPHTDEPGNSLG